MARRQVLVQLDDELVAELDACAESLGTSRSDVLRRSARQYLDSALRAEADRRSIEAYATTPPIEAEVEAWTRLAAESGPAW